MKLQHKVKKILKSERTTKIVAFLVSRILKTLYLTMRCKFQGREHLHNLQGSAILCFWHGRLLMMPNVSQKGAKINILSSAHTDGKLMSEVQKHYGFKTIFGSSSKGGFSALRQIFRVVKGGEILVMTPDGPRGPARKVGGQIIEIAKILDIPIIPVTFSCNNFKTINSWDSLMLPKPFCKGVFIVGAPKKYANNADLEAELNKITDEADVAVKTL